MFNLMEIIMEQNKSENQTVQEISVYEDHQNEIEYKDF